MAATESRPAQPKSILRGHKAQVHAAAFVRDNERLVTGDADGFVIAWDLTILRPRAVWQAHTNAILGISGWGRDRLITHGRDNKLIVWKLREDDESRLSTRLPLDPSPETRPEPWMLHMLEVNTMNFCSFSHCSASLGPSTSSSEILVAVPNTLASEAIDIFHLPSQARQHTVKLGEKNGMVMALSLFHRSQSLTLVAGYENGLGTVAQLDNYGNWVVKYRAQCHSQPILSLDISPAKDFFITSSADAIIAKHPLPGPITAEEPTEKQPTVAETNPSSTATKPIPNPSNPSKSLLSAALANAPPHSATQPPTSPPTPSATTTEVTTSPLATVNTKHSGQQSLRIRSDGRIFATAGWDSKVRVYSTKTLKEVAVLKWHQVGCYAAAFAAVDSAGHEVAVDVEEEGKQTATNDGLDTQGGGSGDDEDERGRGGGVGAGSMARASLVPKLVDMTVREKRVRQARTAHWLAAGSKDGKVSLWDVF
ncbi:hypothetical protein VTK26DRAFT_975 [Humicola hyalothermophila]